MFTKDGGTIYLGLFKDSNEVNVLIYFWVRHYRIKSFFYRMVI